MFEYMTVQDAAKLWGISVRRVQKLCEENRIDGIVRTTLCMANSPRCPSRLMEDINKIKMNL